MSEAVVKAPLELLVEEVPKLTQSLLPNNVLTGSSHNPIKMGASELGLSTYMVFFLVALAVTMVIVFAAKKRMALVPKGRFINGFEMVFDFVRKNIVEGAIHHNAKKYVPIVATVFFFVLINNLLGIVPGLKPGTGTIAGTFCMSISIFIYFTFLGIKEKGGLGYLKGLVPGGLPGWIVPFIWVIEFISMLLKPFTQALRLFANMYAGHIVLGIFALLTELFFMAPFHGSSALYVVGSPVWMVLLFAMYCLELLVALIQAYVFALLTAVYIEQATGGH